MREPDYLAGGPNVNPFLVYAPLFALLGRLLQPPGVFLVLHVVNLLFAALGVAAFSALLRPRLPAWLVLLWVAAGMANPIWSGQAAAIYLEIPVASLALLSLRFFSKGAYRCAAACCLAAYFAKDSALLLATAYAAFALLVLVPSPRLRAARGPLRGRDLAVLGAPLPVLLLLERLKPSYLDVASDLPAAALEFLHWAWLCFPDLLACSAFAAVLFAGAFLSKREVGDAGLLLLLGTLVGGFWLAMLLLPNSLARYTTFALLPMLALLALLLRREPRLSAALAAALATFGILNQDGSLLPPLPTYGSRSGDFLERSREFLRDLEGNRAVCARLEAEHFDREVVAKVPFVQMLRLPALGYVSRPLPRVLAAGQAVTISGAPPFLREAVSPDALYVFSPSIFERGWKPSLRPRRGDVVVFSESSGLAQPVTVYRRRARPLSAATDSPTR